MAVKFEQPRPDVLVCIYASPFVMEDIIRTQKEIASRRKNTDMLYMISDLRNIKLTFSQIVESMGQSLDGKYGYRVGDPGVEIIIVTDISMNKQIAEFYRQDQYGGVRMPVFNSMDEANSYIFSR